GPVARRGKAFQRRGHCQGRVDQVAGHQAKGGAFGMNIYTIFGEIVVNRAEAVRDIQTVEQQAGRTSQRMEGFFGRVYDSVERLSGGLDRLGKRTTDVGKWISTRLTVPITALGGIALNT